MLITWKEVRALEDFIQRLEDGEECQYISSDGEPTPWAFFSNHPHLIMPVGFDEYVSFRARKDFARLWFEKAVEDCGQSIYRQPNGRWLLMFLAPNDRNDQFLFHSRKTLNDPECENEGALRFSLGELFRKLYSIADTVQLEPKTLFASRLWTPSAQEEQRVVLRDCAHDILMALQREKAELRTLHWRQLEDIIAELLRANGMEIHVVRTHPQGGRDIIARGVLIPGEEPMTLAVEVKHRDLVDRPQVEAALWQNRQFPALIMATSGRFSAGVYEEKRLPENQLRLFLKDGVAIGDMIRAYRGHKG